MKHAILLTASAALALGACQQSAAPAAEATDTATATATETTAAPAAAATVAAGQPPSNEFLVGTWGEGDACEMPITFAAGGKITNGPAETWTLDNGELVMGGEFKIKLVLVDNDTMESVADGSTEKRTLKRCG